MAEIINLRRVRKQKTRSDREQKADANRTKFGRSKAEKSVSKLTNLREKSHIDGHKLSTRYADRPDNDSD